MNVLHYFKEMGKALAGLLTSIKGWFIIIFSQFLAVGSVKKGLILLLTAYIVDFATGLIASFIEEKRNGFRPAVYFFESSKARDSLAKAITYMMVILLGYGFYCLFFDATFPLPGSSKQFTIVEIIIGVCIAIESWSNVENMKRCGFDIFGEIVRIAKKVWGIVNTVKNGE